MASNTRRKRLLRKSVFFSLILSGKFFSRFRNSLNLTCCWCFETWVSLRVEYSDKQNQIQLFFNRNWLVSLTCLLCFAPPLKPFSMPPPSEHRVGHVGPQHAPKIYNSSQLFDVLRSNQTLHCAKDEPTHSRMRKFFFFFLSFPSFLWPLDECLSRSFTTQSIKPKHNIKAEILLHPLSTRWSKSKSFDRYLKANKNSFLEQRNN